MTQCVFNLTCLTTTKNIKTINNSIAYNCCKYATSIDLNGAFENHVSDFWI